MKLPKLNSPVMRRVSRLLVNKFDFIFGSGMIPPKLLSYFNRKSYIEEGNNFFKYFKTIGGLKQYHKVLDVGCGVGRMAVPLTGFLKPHASYDGFDILDFGILWCQKRITSRYPNFKFHFADIYNKEYNPTGKIKASEYTFPYESESFDFIFLTSVFTHLLPGDMEHYVSEIARVLKKDGKCLITVFFNNEEAVLLTKAGKSYFNFKYISHYYSSINEKTPEAAISFSEGYFSYLLIKHGLFIEEPIYYGAWCGRENYTGFQDMVVCSKQK